MIARRRRVEAEAKRISDEVSRQARERLRQARERAAAADAAASVAPPARPSQEPGVRPTERRLPAAMSLRRILVPLDGAAYAERALPYALALARATQGDITIAHIRLPSEPAPQASMSARSASPTGGEAVGEVSDFAGYLRWLREERMAAAPHVAVELVDAPSALGGLLELEERAQSDVVVLATHGRQGVERLLLGSVADGLVHGGRAMVFVVPPVADAPVQALPTLSRILVPLDGSALAEQALRPVLDLLGSVSRQPNGPGSLKEVMLFYVAGNGGERRDAERYLQSVRKLIAAEAPETPVNILARAIMGSPPGAIVGAADRGLVDLAGQLVPFDLIVMATHGRSGLGRWLYGSVAGYVVSRVHAPVLLVRPASGERSR
jgi:nucleotide-binding universal stress UspA family protein